MTLPGSESRQPPAAPRLPDEELLALIEGFFRRREEFLGLASGRPLYVLEPAVLRRRAARFCRAFSALGTRTGFYYAVKSNNHPEVARTLVAAGFGLDVSSGLELAMALELGCGDLVFSGPGKTMEELAMARDHADRLTLLVDSPGELERLAALCRGLAEPLAVGVRLCPDERGLWRKFGIPLAELGAFIARAMALPGLRFQGIQFHTSWNLGPEAQIAFIERLGQAIAALPEAARESIAFIDVGGGYWPEEGEWLRPAGTALGLIRKAQGLEDDQALGRHRLPALDLERFAARLCAAIRAHLLGRLDCRICFEPGRWLCHPAMHLLLNVVDKKGLDLVITDGGTNMVGWERFESDYFPVLNLSRPAWREQACLVLGSLCTPHDVWGYDYWGAGIEPGDVLLVPNQGAYTYSLRQHFIKAVPEVVVLQETPELPSGWPPAMPGR